MSLFNIAPEEPGEKLDEATALAVEVAMTALRNDTDVALNLSGFDIGDDVVGDLAPLIAKCQKLTKVDLHDCNITDQGAMYLTNALITNESVANVDLSGNDQITAGAARHLAELATHSETFNKLKLSTVELPLDELAGRGRGRNGETISFCGMPLTPLDFVMIGETMKANNRTRKLELRGLPMTDLDMSWITGMLRGNTSLRTFILSARQLGEPGVRTLLQAVASSHLEVLDLQAAQIPASAASALTDLVGNGRLKKLHLYWNSLGDAGTNALCGALMQQPPPVLNTLVLYNNNVTSTGAIAVAEMLKRNTVLRSIALVSNKLGEEGCAAISEAAAMNTTLVTLDVSRAHLGWNIVDMKRVFTENRVLTNINISGNLMNATESAELAMALRGNTTLKLLTLSVTPLPAQALLGTAQPPVTELNFCAMELSTVDMHFIAKCLRVNEVLEKLDVSNNAVRLTSTHFLARNLHHNNTLLSLRMDKVWLPVQDLRGQDPLVARRLAYPAAGLEMRDFVIVGELLRKNNHMTTLDLRGNDMFTGNEVRCLKPALKTNTSLTELTFVWNTFGPEGMVTLAEGIAHHPNLRRLTLRAVGIGGKEGAVALASIVANIPSLTFLECVLNSLGAAGAASLAGALQANNTLTEVDLHNNLMGDEGAASLAAALERKSPLTKLNLRENKITAAGALSLSDAMCGGLCPLRDLNLSYNEIGVGGAHSMAEMLRLNSCLRRLDLNSTRVHSEGAAAVGAMLRVNRTLSFLRISCKTVGTEGALAIADALKYNREMQTVQLGTCKLPCQALLGSTSQTRIDLSNSHLTDLDCAFVAECLRSNRVCTYLDVSGNSIKNHAVDVLNHALQFNVVLKTLKLDELELAVQDLFGSTGANSISFAGQYLSQRDAVFIAATLKVNTPMSTLDLTNCNISPAACQHLGEAFTKNGAITKLKLGHNDFGVVGAIALAPVLKADNVLQVLDLAGCEVGMEGSVALAKAVKDNWVIEFIRFDVFPLPVQSLRGHEDVTVLDFAYQELNWHDVSFMCEVLRHNKFVTELDLSGNDLRNTSARAVATLCKENRFIRSIRMMDNEFNSVVGHIFADNLAGNRVVVNLELDDSAMVKRTRRELRLLIKLNRRFVGEFKHGRLVQGEHRFMNGDVLRFKGDDALNGYEAHGTYCVAECPWPEVLLVLTSLLTNYLEVGFSIAAIIALLAADDPPVGWVSVAIVIMILVALVTAKMVWASGRQSVAWMQAVGLLILKDAYHALHSRKVANVTLDIRSEVPLFTFLSVADLRAMVGVFRGGPNALIFTGMGFSMGWSLPVLGAALSCTASVITAMVVSDFHWVRVASWSRKVEALEEFDAALEDQIVKVRKSRSMSGSSGSDIENAAAAAKRAAANREANKHPGDDIPDLRALTTFKLDKRKPRVLQHPWEFKISMAVLIFRSLEIASRVAGYCLMIALFGGFTALLMLFTFLFMFVYWSWEGDKVMDDFPATALTIARVLFSSITFPGYGDEAPSWVKGTQRMAPGLFFVLRCVEDLFMGILILALGMGNDAGISDLIVGLVGGAVLLKIVVSILYILAMDVINAERTPVEYQGVDLIAARDEIEYQLLYSFLDKSQPAPHQRARVYDVETGRGVASKGQPKEAAPVPTKRRGSRGTPVHPEVQVTVDVHDAKAAAPMATPTGVQLDTERLLEGAVLAQQSGAGSGEGSGEGAAEELTVENV